MTTTLKQNGKGEWIGRYRGIDGEMHRANLGKGEDCARERLERIVQNEGRVANFDPDGLWFDLMTAYGKHMILNGVDESYVTQTLNVLGRVIVEYNMAEGRDFNFKSCSRFLADMKERGRSSQTLNVRVTQLTAFSRWLVASGEADVVLNLKRIRRDAEPTFQRRVLTCAEEHKLRDYLSTCPMKLSCGLYPGYRWSVYDTALGTGYRASELAALQWSDFHEATADVPPFISLPARYTKNKKAARQPIKASLGAYLSHCRGEDEMEMYPGWVVKRAGFMLRKDLEKAGVQCDTDEGKIDFHSLRHTYITRLVQAGVPVAVVQKLARHADVKTTLSYYVHLGDDDLASAVERLP